jgi:hypothetical protein
MECRVLPALVTSPSLISEYLDSEAIMQNNIRPCVALKLYSTSVIP